MRSAASVFYLAVFALLGPAHGDHGTATRSRSSPPDSCAIDPQSIVSDACASYSTLDNLNDELIPALEVITQTTDFFAYYRLNLFNKACPFWNDANSMCGNRACAVDTLDNEEDIPPIWRKEELSKLEGPKAVHPGRRLREERPRARPLQGMLGDDVDESCVVEYDDECDERDYCVPEDEGAAAKGDYVSLVNNTERFTGYAGPGARQVWDAIYRENCFSKPIQQSVPLGKASPSGAVQAASDLRSVIQEHGRHQGGSEDDLYPLDDECLEKRAFYRVISGMHASISTHLCFDYLNQTTGQWGPNLQCYKERLHDHPERVSNLYFNYALMVRAVAKLRKHLQGYTFCSGDPLQDRETKQKVLQLADKAARTPQIFDETVMFQDQFVDLKEDFRDRFRNVSRLMDCVGCDRCRLWGKVQTAGYGAALKVLFEFDETKNGENPPLRRTELVALVNTLDRISHSLMAIQQFRAAITSEEGRIIDQQTASIRSSEEPENNHRYDFEDEAEEEAYKVNYDATFMESAMAEINTVWKAYIYVLKTWISLPGEAFAILVMESNRLWNYWLGLPVGPRTWEIRLPQRDEL